jgi:hypothetical protein
LHLNTTRMTAYIASPRYTGCTMNEGTSFSALGQICSRQAAVVLTVSLLT